MIVLRLLMVGYVAVGRHVKHGAPFYAQLARGVNPTTGLVGAGLAFVGYNALQISLYGLIGTKVQRSGRRGVMGVGVRRLAARPRLGSVPGTAGRPGPGVLLALEVGVIGLFIAAGFTHPASGSVSVAVFAPSRLLVPAAVAGVIVFAVASFAGVESVLAFAEDATSERAVARAAGGAVIFCGLLYALAAWSYGEWIGLDHLGRAVEDASQPLTLLGAMFGPGITDLATMLLVTSVLAAMVSFHATVARYVFALARERVLPARWAAVSRGVNGGAPLGGSAVQAVVALLVVVGFLLSGADPMTMFIWLSTVGAVCVLLLLTLASWSALLFFDKGWAVTSPAGCARWSRSPAGSSACWPWCS
jgi:amino acid transporter